MLSICVLFSQFFTHAAHADTNAAPVVYTLDAGLLAIARQRVAASDATVMPAYRQLLRSADKALNTTPFSVTDKGVTPPSGDKHDYLSMAPYWWPDPSKPNGLPYMRRDGHINPSTKNNDTDSKRIEDFSNAVGALGIGYYFTGDARYAQHAALLLRTWFLDPATRMNPNLKYGQAVMGSVDGRGTGIIDTRHFWQVVDAIGLIAPSGKLSDAELAGLRQWFTDYTQWLLTSKEGNDEAAARNNHGSYFDEQVANYALFTGDKDLARKLAEQALQKRIDVQIAADGRQPMELERTRAFHYSTFNLVALSRLARYGEQVGVDVWHYPDATRPALRRALDYLTQYVVNPSAWPYKDIQGVGYADYLPLMLQYERVYGVLPEAATVESDLRGQVPTATDWLLWPLVQPAVAQPGNAS
ncbi:alginate lyase family protein [Paraburkholderia xenovorans]|uniref:alginate lyase family protein n=1 Tax=Paraburkholderia xenovorans TaxID=36873 RepID=UPI0038B8B776